MKLQNIMFINSLLYNYCLYEVVVKELDRVYLQFVSLAINECALQFSKSRVKTDIDQLKYRTSFMNEKQRKCLLTLTSPLTLIKAPTHKVHLSNKH